MKTCFRPSRLNREAHANRRGAVVVLLAVVSILLFVMMAFMVDIPYMQLVRTELRAATDAAAKAGAESLYRTKNPSKAIEAAIEVASLNTVAGKGLILDASQVDLGRCNQQPDGSYKHESGGQPYNSVRITSRLDGNNPNGPVNLFFGSLLGVGTFKPQEVATAGKSVVEICLVLDRSHSMTFDLSGTDWVYPAGIRYPAGYNQAPHAALSRWAALEKAVKSFTAIIQKQPTPPRVGLVTWGSNITTGGITTPASIIDSPLTTNMLDITSKLRTRGSKPMWGATNMAAGIDMGRSVLTAPTVNPNADKVMILMTDGLWNNGREPTLAAEDAKKAGIIVHTVCLLAGKSEAVCQDVARITGGRYYYAGNADQLTAAFEKLARQMAVTLIE